jgi:hypothetical protein
VWETIARNRAGNWEGTRLGSCLNKLKAFMQLQSDMIQSEQELQPTHWLIKAPGKSQGFEPLAQQQRKDYRIRDGFCFLLKITKVLFHVAHRRFINYYFLFFHFRFVNDMHAIHLFYFIFCREFLSHLKILQFV